MRYTTDGSQPTASSPVIPAPFSVSGTVTINAAAFRPGWTPSTTSTAAYVLQPAVPTFSVAPGTYNADFYVTVNSTTPSTTLRNTTDGTDPSASSPVSSPSYYVGTTVTLKVKAFRTGWTPSATATASYLLQPLPPTASSVGGTYDLGQEVTLTAAGPLDTIRYTTDGTVPTATSPIYSPSSPLLLTGPITLRARSFRSQYSPSTELVQEYVTRVATPTLSPAGGEFAQQPIVTMSTTTTGATIRYTLNGDLPTESSTVYSGPISMALDSTVTAKAFKTGWAESEPSLVQVYVSTAPPPVSGGTVSPAPSVAAGFTSVTGAAVFNISGALLSSAPGAVVAYRAQTALAVTIPNSTSFQVGGLVEGSNELDIYGVDSQGLPFELRSTVWAGSRSLNVTVRDRNQQVISGAWVYGFLGEDYEIFASGVTSGSGLAVLSDTPGNSALLAGVYATGYRPRTVVIGAGQTSLTVNLDVDNNDFSAGLAGWTNSAGGNANIVEHSEAFPGWASCPTCVGRQGESSAGAALASAGQAPASQSPTADNDVMVETFNAFGPQTVSRRFVVTPGISRVRIRYQFATYERFATQAANDTFLVRLTNTTTGATVQEATTVFGLWTQLDSVGATGWRTLDLPVGADEEVEVILSTQNASDAAYDSLILGDVITEQGLQVPVLELYDQRLRQPPAGATDAELWEKLDYLSVSQHPSYNGMTRVNGTLHVIGAATDRLQSVTLEVYEGTTLRATANLVPSAAQYLIGVPFETNGVMRVNTPELFFEIPSSQLAAINQTTEETLQLRVRLVSVDGHTAVINVGEPGVNSTPGRKVKKLVRYTLGNRFNPRDLVDCVVLANSIWPNFPCGGDGWTLPKNVQRAAALNPGTYATFNGVAYNDFSNMNAGHFPDHTSHDTGKDVDVAWLSGSTPTFSVDKASAEALIALFRSPGGAAIDFVYVTFEGKPCTPNPCAREFWSTIRDAMVGTERLIPLAAAADVEAKGAAASIIRDVGRVRYRAKHLTHFHIRWKD